MTASSLDISARRHGGARTRVIAKDAPLTRLRTHRKRDRNRVPWLALLPKAWRHLMKRLLIGCCIAVIAGPALSQLKKREAAFYVVLNTLTKQCSVVDKEPKTDSPNITVASDTVYASRAEAETAIKALKSCTP
jgi:hypothetical protein